MNKTIKQAERYEAPETRVLYCSCSRRIMATSDFTEQLETWDKIGTEEE